MTPEDLNRVLETERINLHLLEPKEPGFAVWAKEKLMRMGIIREHIEETRVAIENCSECSGGCSDCLRLKK